MNIAIIGCGYVGYAVGKYWHSNSNFMLTVTTTSPERIPILETITPQVIVTPGKDLVGLKAVLKNQKCCLVKCRSKKRRFL